MPMMNNRYQWGAVAVALHWIVFLMVVGLVASGKISAQGERPDPDLMAVHAPMGAALLFVMLARYFWRLINPSVGRVDDAVGLATAIPAWLVHNLLYLTIIAQALLGIAMAQMGGRGVGPPGWELPHLIGRDGWLPLNHPLLARLELGDTPQAARMALRELHGLTANILIGLVGLHILGALYHRFGRRDHLLRRMWFGYIPPALRLKKE